MGPVHRPNAQRIIGDRSLWTYGAALISACATTHRTAHGSVGRGTKLRLIGHRIFVPKEGRLWTSRHREAAVMDIYRRFHLKAILFDPWQGISSAQKLQKIGVNVVEFADSGTFIVMAGSISDLIQSRAGSPCIRPVPNCAPIGSHDLD